MDWEALYGVADGIKCRSVGSALTADELQALLAGLNIDPDTARCGEVVALPLAAKVILCTDNPRRCAVAPAMPASG